MLKALSVKAETSDNKVILIDKTQKLQVLEDKDLFDDMKECMPGDTRTETVQIDNNLNQKATFYLYATVDSTQENDKLVAQANYAAELMKLIHLTVLDKTNNKIIYKGPATGNPLDKVGDQEIVGSMVKNVDGNGAYGVLLGDIAEKTSIMLEVTIVIPGAGIDNRFQDSFGYVKWVFSCEGSDTTPTEPVTPTPTNPPVTPTPPTTTPTEPVTPTPPTTTPTDPITSTPPTTTPTESVTPTLPTATPTEPTTPTPIVTPTPTPTATVVPTPDGEDGGTPTPTGETEDDNDDDLPKTGAEISYMKPLLALLVILSLGLFLLDRIHKKKIKE